jgi:hypothetical protein
MYIHVYEEGWRGSGIAFCWQVAAFVSPSRTQLNEIRDWCGNAFGESGLRWRDDIRFGEVRFSDPADLSLFLLKWQ